MPLDGFKTPFFKKTVSGNFDFLPRSIVMTTLVRGMRIWSTIKVKCVSETNHTNNQNSPTQFLKPCSH